MTIFRAFALLAIVFFMSRLALAAPREVRFKDVTLDLKAGDRISIRGWNGGVKLVGSANGMSFVRARKVLPDHASAAASARFDALTYSARREGSTQIIEVTGPTTQTEWNEWLKAPPSTEPQLILEISATSVPVDLYLHEGNVDISQWKDSVLVTLIEGNLHASASEGRLVVQMQKGEVHIETQRGNVEIDAGAAKVNAHDVEGDVTLADLSGDSTLSDIHGGILVRSYGGHVNVMKSSGSVEFEIGRGALNLGDFEGPVKGQVDQGAFSASLVGDVDVNVEAQDGSVSVKLPKDVSANVTLRTDEGAITAPSDVKPQNGDRRRMSGHLEGTRGKGSVSIRTARGPIHLH